MTRALLVAFGITGLCVVIHVMGIAILGEEMLRWRERIQKPISFPFAAALLMVIFGAIIFLHVVEATIWAVCFYVGGLFPTFETALYCSLTSYSTAGYGDVLLPPKWRLLGTIEAVSGVLLCGLSAAFLFAVINIILRARGRRLHEELTHQIEE